MDNLDTNKWIDKNRLLRKNKHIQFGTILVYFLFILVSLMMIAPLLWLFSSSLKPLSQIFGSLSLIPKQPSLENFHKLFQYYNIGHILLNSFVVAVTMTCGGLFFCSLAGYGFAKYNFPGKEALFGIILLALMIPPQVTMIPLYGIFVRIGWIDKLQGLIIPNLASAFGIFFMRQFIRDIPDELIESARIDGCSEIQIFFNIILPLLWPAFAALGLIFFMNSWNEFFWPLILIRSQEVYTITVAIYRLFDPLRNPYDMIMAASTIAVLPLLVVFLLGQRLFIQGITEGAVKG